MIKGLKDISINIIIMSTPSASVEKKTKKVAVAKKSSSKEVKTATSNIKEESVKEESVKEESVKEENVKEEIKSENQDTSNDDFYSMMDKTINMFNELNEISKKLDIIDEKQIKLFIVEKRKMDKAINTFEISYLESLANAFKISKKASSKKSSKKVVDPSNPVSEPAVKKPLECNNCLHTFLGKTDTTELISRNQAYTAVTDFVKHEKKTNPEKISANLGNDKEFRVYGGLKTFLDSISKIIVNNIKTVESEIKICEAAKPEEGSKQMKELSNLHDEIERLNKLKNIPDVMGYTNVMSYTNLCFTNDYVNKIKAKPSKTKSTKKIS